MSLRSAKPSKPPNQQVAPKPSSISSSSSSSLSTHLAMVELKQRILTSLNKLADRDTHQIAVEDLESIIKSLSSDGISMVLNCMYDAVNDPKPAVKKEGVRLLAFLCNVHTDPAASHLTKIIAHVVRRLKESDSQVRETCREAIGSLAGLYLKGGNGSDGVVSLFVKPLFEVMSENNKSAQSGAALCLAKMVECAADTPLITFQKLCSRVCKYLNNSNFMAKASMLQVVSSLSQVGAITQQNLEPLLQSIQLSLRSSDWATRKAAADTLSVLSSNAGKITTDVAVSTLNALEASRFDKVKPVRESMTEALHLWRKIAGKDGSSDEHKAPSHDGNTFECADLSDRVDGDRENRKPVKDSSCGSSPTDSNINGKGNDVLDKAVGILKKKAPALTDKLNPEFFQKLETRVSVPVEVILPRRHANSSILQDEEQSESRSSPSQKAMPKFQDGYGPSEDNHGSTERGTIGGLRDCSQIETSGCMDSSKGNLLAIQRQLLLLEKQQSHLMNMIQGFMGGSHDSMVTLENRVRGLERIVEDMALDLSISSHQRGNSAVVGFEGSSNRPLGKYNGFADYSNGKFGRGNNGRLHLGERFAAFDGITAGSNSRGSTWRSDAPNVRDFHVYGKNEHVGSRKAGGGGPTDNRSGKLENEADHVGGKRGWNKGAAPVRFSEGPSARSIWQASKDEATLAAIRVAGEDNGDTRNAQVTLPKMISKVLGNDGALQACDSLRASWSSAMEALQASDMESAFSEILSTGNDYLLLKLMDRSGPIINQLSNEVAGEVVNAIARFLMDPDLLEMCLCWLQQLADIVTEKGPDPLDIPMEVRREILVSLQDTCISTDMGEEWEGSTRSPEQVLHQLASGWDIDD